MNPSDDQVQTLWAKYSNPSTRRIDYRQFLVDVHEADYEAGGKGSNSHVLRGLSEPTSTTYNDVVLASVGQRRCVRPQEHEVFKNEHHSEQQQSTVKLSLAKVESLIKMKIMNVTRADSVEFRGAYDLFGRPKKGVDKETFKLKLNQWHVFLADAELEMLFAKYDTNGNGLIEFDEFLDYFGSESSPSVLGTMHKSLQGNPISDISGGLSTNLTVGALQRHSRPSTEQSRRGSFNSGSKESVKSGSRRAVNLAIKVLRFHAISPQNYATLMNYRTVASHCRVLVTRRRRSILPRSQRPHARPRTVCGKTHWMLPRNLGGQWGLPMY